MKKAHEKLNKPVKTYLINSKSIQDQNFLIIWITTQDNFSKVYLQHQQEK